MARFQATLERTLRVEWPDSVRVRIERVMRRIEGIASVSRIQCRTSSASATATAARIMPTGTSGAGFAGV
ncbi:MAG TPA: hypothetical protein VEI07_20095, partial [Planctomycetaceae bacterium]|nr:hypothetical protein [Planctomycetaceae bacterium]